MRRKLNKVLVVYIIFVLLFSCVFKLNVSLAENEPSENQPENSEEVVQEENQVENSGEVAQEENKEPNYEEEMEGLENQKSDLENKISSTEAQIGVVEGVLTETLEEIEQLSTKIDQKRKEISNLEIQEFSLMKIIEDEEIKLEEATERYKNEKELLEKRLIIMYEMGDMSVLDLLVSSGSISDFLSRYYLLSKIGDADKRLVDNVKKDKKQSESITKSLNEKKSELEKDKLDKEKYAISLDNMEILKNNKMNNLNEEEIKLYDEIENYRKEIENIENEIKEISLKNLGQKYIGGNFIWPTPGYTTITSQFGMRTHPITGIYKLHSGTDIGAPYGANFLAANDGVVVKAYYNSAYGNMVLIDHGGGVMTLYAHGSSIEVSEGDVVKQGQTVLKVGATGYATGPHAHFEIRVNGEYMNPLDYISPDNGQAQKDDNENLTVVLN